MAEGTEVPKGGPQKERTAGRDFYGDLGITKTSTSDDIKKAYRKLAREFHPDVNPGNKDAEEKFKNVSEAYDILSDPKKRELVDLGGYGSRVQDGEPDPYDKRPGESTPDWTRRIYEGMGLNPEDFLKDDSAESPRREKAKTKREKKARGHDQEQKKDPEPEDPKIQQDRKDKRDEEARDKKYKVDDEALSQKYAAEQAARTERYQTNDDSVYYQRLNEIEKIYEQETHEAGNRYDKRYFDEPVNTEGKPWWRRYGENLLLTTNVVKKLEDTITDKLGDALLYKGADASKDFILADGNFLHLATNHTTDQHYKKEQHITVETITSTPDEKDDYTSQGIRIVKEESGKVWIQQVSAKYRKSVGSNFYLVNNYVEEPYTPIFADEPLNNQDLKKLMREVKSVKVPARTF